MCVNLGLMCRRVGDAWDAVCGRYSRWSQSCLRGRFARGECEAGGGGVREQDPPGARRAVPLVPQPPGDQPQGWAATPTRGALKARHRASRPSCRAIRQPTSCRDPVGQQDLRMPLKESAGVDSSRSDFEAWVRMGAAGSPRRRGRRLVRRAQGPLGVQEAPGAEGPGSKGWWWRRTGSTRSSCGQAGGEGPVGRRRPTSATPIRRATFDLTGLAPDARGGRRVRSRHLPDAFAKVIDRLLAARTTASGGRAWLRRAHADSKGAVSRRSGSSRSPTRTATGWWRERGPAVRPVPHPAGRRQQAAAGRGQAAAGGDGVPTIAGGSRTTSRTSLTTGWTS